MKRWWLDNYQRTTGAEASGCVDSQVIRYWGGYRNISIFSERPHASLYSRRLRDEGGQGRRTARPPPSDIRSERTVFPLRRDKRAARRRGRKPGRKVCKSGESRRGRWISRISEGLMDIRNPRCRVGLPPRPRLSSRTVAARAATSYD